MFRMLRYGTLTSKDGSKTTPLEFRVYQCQTCKSWIDHTKGESVVTKKTDKGPVDLCPRCHLSETLREQTGLTALDFSPSSRRNTWEEFLETMLKEFTCIRCGVKKKRVLFERAFTAEENGVCQPCAKKAIDWRKR